MATIVTFVPRAPAARTAPPAGSTGSVVFFTGVRYEKPDPASRGREGEASGGAMTVVPKPN